MATRTYNRTPRTNRTTAPKEQGRNKRMNDETYAERRIVMNYIYEAKNLLKRFGYQMPRIDIRITEGKDRSVLGQAQLSDNIVWIPQHSLKRADLREVVFHELVHAITGFRHDKACPLMSPCVEGLSVEKTNRLFLNYFKF